MTSSSDRSSSRTSFTLASRKSKLAVVQLEMVQAELARAHPNYTFPLDTYSVEGDRDKVQALYVIGGKSLWTKDLEVALLDRQVDMLVHCLKDMPTVLPDGCELGAILERENPLDTLVVKKGLSYKSLDELPDGSVVGTSSIRRVAQLRRAYPKLKFQDVVRCLSLDDILC
jgi:hydroxymethylbilane synthase